MEKEELIGRLEEAAQTLAAAYQHNMLEERRWDILLSIPISKDPVSIPTSDQLSRLDEVFKMMSVLDEAEQKVMWMRSYGVSWRIIQWKNCLSRTEAWGIYTHALEKILEHRASQGTSKPEIFS